MGIITWVKVGGGDWRVGSVAVTSSSTMTSSVGSTAGGAAIEFSPPLAAESSLSGR